MTAESWLVGVAVSRHCCHNMMHDTQPGRLASKGGRAGIRVAEHKTASLLIVANERPTLRPVIEYARIKITRLRSTGQVIVLFVYPAFHSRSASSSRSGDLR